MRALNQVVVPILLAVAVLPVSAQIRSSRTPDLKRLPLSFEPNVGQAPHSEVEFLVRGGEQTLFLNSRQAVLQLNSLEQPPAGFFQSAAQAAGGKQRTAAIRMSLRNTRKPTAGEPLDPLPGKVNYFLGNDPRKWRTGIPTFARVAYRNVYDGIDLVYYGHNGSLEYDFVAQPWADPKSIEVEFEGAGRAALTQQGDLILESPAGTVRWQKPFVYQEDRGVRRAVAAHYRLGKGFRVTFEFAEYDRSRPLVIDPVLVYSTFLGGGSADFTQNCLWDSTGIYLTGATYSANFPATGGAFDRSLRGTYDIFVTKLNPDGTSLLYSTYIGGSGIDSPNFARLKDGAVYLTGFTTSKNYPTTVGAFNTSFNGGLEDLFVTKLAPGGNSLAFSTYLGGSGDDNGLGLDLDSTGNVYLTGYTNSPNYPITAGAFQRTFGGGDNDSFVAKLNSSGTALIYSTYLGGSGDEQLPNPSAGPEPPQIVFLRGSSIAVDAAGSAYVCGVTTSADFPTTPGAYSNTYRGGGGDATLTKLAPDGSRIAFSTYFGSTGFDACGYLNVDPAGSVLAAGVTGSSDFPTTPGAFGRAYAGGSEDAFVTRFDSTGSAILSSTLYGGSGQEAFASIAVAGNGYVLLSGLTYSSDLPLTARSYQATYGGQGDVFFAVFDPTLSTLVDSTYLGTPLFDIGAAAFGSGPTDILVFGSTSSSAFPTTPGAYGRTYNGGGRDAYLARFTLTTNCAYSINPAAATFPSAGSAGTVTVSSGSNCPWVASSNAAFIAITAGGSGSGNGTVSLQVQANAGAARSGSVTIADQSFTVNQDAAGCTFSLSANGSSFGQAAGTGSVQVNPSAQTCSWTTSNNSGFVVLTSGSTGAGAGVVAYSVPANPGSARSATLTIAGLPYTVTQAGTSSSGTRFVPVAPCRLVDTRLASGPFGGPQLAANSTRSFPLPGLCNLPATAQAFALNVTVVPAGPLVYLTIWPTGQSQPFVSTLNSLDGRITSNAAIVPAGSGGSVTIFVTDATHVIADVNGYFDGSSGSSFYPATPCRVSDTRLPVGIFGGPQMTANSTRTIPIPSGNCSIPATAAAYSANLTVVPAEPLGFLSVWPAGSSQPSVSTLNSPLSAVVANAAIVPAGVNGAVSTFVTNRTDVIFDVNGYFAPPGATGALSFYPVTPCRVADTRLPPGTFGGPAIAGNTARDFPVSSSACGIPVSAKAYSLNVTVVPPGLLSYLTLYPSGQSVPFVSTLNSDQGRITANAAIVPAGAGGSVGVFVTNATHVILDINGYFAP